MLRAPSAGALPVTRGSHGSQKLSWVRLRRPLLIHWWGSLREPQIPVLPRNFQAGELDEGCSRVDEGCW